jgi:hypothetical protein
LSRHDPVFDLLEAQRADHAVAEGPRNVVGVIHKDARQFAATGGWGFEGFGGGDPARPVLPATPPKKTTITC